ncbi:hypothetical protein ACHAW5_008611 [Stephanodiscus triporus]|uniref:PX domain-containing protein n=1 Tax=Stephanodiscus triporus TaxID=2934178 RepID=A0ABD3NCC5_9STRA
MSPRNASSPGACSVAADGNEQDAALDTVKVDGDGDGDGGGLPMMIPLARARASQAGCEGPPAARQRHVVTVSDPVQCAEGIKGKYTSYRVACDPPLLARSSSHSPPPMSHPTSANRRYSEFCWLFERMHKERPGSIVPPLPDKHRRAGSSLFDGTFIEERRSQLEAFLRRAVRNPELADAECLIVFLGGSDAEFKKALRDGGGGSSSSSSSSRGGGGGGSNPNVEDEHGGPPHHAYDGNEMETNCHPPHDARDHPPSPAAAENRGGGTMEKLTAKKAAGLKKWIKEKKTTMQGATARMPDDAIFERATHHVEALEAGLCRIEAQASRLVRNDVDVSSCMLEFGLGCDALARVDDEVDGAGGGGVNDDDDDDDASSTPRSSGIGMAFRLIGRAADRASASCSTSRDDERGGWSARFLEPIRDHLRVVRAARVALSKRNSRLVTYSTCLNAVDSKRASLHRYRISGDHQRAIGAEASLCRAEAAAIEARANYDEVSARVLREVDRFRREYAVEMYATMSEFVRAQKEHYDAMSDVWSSLLPEVEGIDASTFNGSSFAREAAALREGKAGAGSSGGGIEAVHFENMPMPTYPPPPEPANDAYSRNVLESSMLNGAIRYRDVLPEE